MHHCVGNDDLENKKIYEESLRPEGIRKTLQIKEHTYAFESHNNSRSQKKIKQKFRKNSSNQKKKREIAGIIAVVATIISILFSLLEAILG